MIQPGDTILFQGDSITDTGRQKAVEDQTPPANNIHALGTGYAGKAAGMLMADHPEWTLRCYNRGISGNRVTQLLDRYETGFAQLKPDLLSILIGVNDTWHGVASGTPANGVDLPTFDRVFRELLARLTSDFPALRLVICEPFVLEAGAVLRMKFHPDIDERRALVKQIATDVKARYVPFQDMFDALVEKAPPAYWAPDGVHPSPAGHEAMARFWVKTVLG